MNYGSEYITKNVITYLGNKRKLLPFINGEICDIVKHDPELSTKNHSDIVIFDIFSGSGVVARCLKQSGFYVLANDLEVYSTPINKTFIETNKEDLQNVFYGVKEKLVSFYSDHSITFHDSCTGDNYKDTVNMLNSVRDLGKHQTKPYFSVHYAPKDTDNYDFNTERLFYTQENGRFIDAVLEVVFNDSIFNNSARNIILADLFVKMTTNINTSGTMKGFHNGWGGIGENSVTRIKADIMLSVLDLIDDVPRGKCFNDYAEQVFINNPDLNVDIIYADPPYNQHQYSANYHMLTTAYNNRDYDVGEVVQGSRAGIRTDHNRSDFSKGNSKGSTAYTAFDKFIKNSTGHTKYIIISYNQEGILGHEELIDVLSQNGTNTVDIKIQKHEKYKGGKNTNISNSVVEYLFIVKVDVAQSQEEILELKNSVVSNTHKKLIMDKYINLSKVKKEPLCSVSENTLGQFIIDFDIENGKPFNDFVIVNSEYKVITDATTHTNELMDVIKSIEYKDFEKEELLQQYIEDQNFTSAIKMLKSFKIKKFKDMVLPYINILSTVELDKKQQRDFQSLKKSLNI